MASKLLRFSAWPPPYNMLTCDVLTGMIGIRNQIEALTPGSYCSIQKGTSAPAAVRKCTSEKSGCIGATHPMVTGTWKSVSGGPGLVIMIGD